MSTRGCVAIAKGKGWIGVYNHFDSYPEGLGKNLWAHLKSNFKISELSKFAENLLQFDDWRNYLNGKVGVCEYCGKKGLGQPHSINGRICFVSKKTNNDLEITYNLNKIGYPDPEAKYHQHGNLSNKMTSEEPDPLFIEWVYVIDPKEQTFSVYASRRAKGSYKKKSSDGLRSWKSPNYEHFLVKRFLFKGAEPNWKSLGKKANRMCEAAEERFGGTK